MASYNCNISNEEARSEIDKEIKRLEESIRALKSSRNQLSSISRCPPELLSRIFLFCAASSSSCNDIHGLLCWVGVTRVCGHWREIALGCPELWRKICLSSPQWAEEMLKRSKLSSLTFVVDTSHRGSGTPEKLFNAIFDHLPRIQTLDLTACGLTMNQYLTHATCSAPVLEHLSLHRLDLPYIHHQFLVPENFLKGGAPCLRRLELLNCVLKWNAAFLRSLTHVKVHNIDISFRPKILELIDALENMPSLEEFDFEDCLPILPDNASTVPQPARTITIPNLSHMRISSSVLECANLMNHISFLHNVPTMSLACYATHTAGHDFSSVLTTLSSCMGSIKEAIHSLILDTYISSHVRIRCWTGDTTKDNSFHSSRNIPIDLKFNWRGHEPNAAAAVVAAACMAIPLLHLRSLSVSSRTGFSLDQQTWSTVFGKLPKLQFVHVDGESLPSLIKALEEEQKVVTISRSDKQVSSQQNEPTSKIYFPALRRLTLQQVNFEKEIDGVGPVTKSLRDCLMKRRRHNAEIHTLTLRSCRRLRTELLRDVVNVVEDETELVHFDEYSLQYIFGISEISRSSELEVNGCF